MAKKQATAVIQSSVPMISVTVGYRGKSTGERYIAPGIYAVNDPDLYGQAEFLVASGRAEFLPTVELVEETVTTVTDVTPQNEQKPTEQNPDGNEPTGEKVEA